MKIGYVIMTTPPLVVAGYLWDRIRYSLPVCKIWRF